MSEVSWVSLQTNKIKMYLCTQSRKHHHRQKHTKTGPFSPAGWYTPVWPCQDTCSSQGTGMDVQSVSLTLASFKAGCKNVTSEELVCVYGPSNIHLPIPVFANRNTEEAHSACSHTTHVFSFLLDQNKKSHWFLLFMLPLLAPANNCHCCFSSIFDEQGEVEWRSPVSFSF